MILGIHLWLWYKLDNSVGVLCNIMGEYDVSYKGHDQWHSAVFAIVCEQCKICKKWLETEQENWIYVTVMKWLTTNWLSF